MKPNPRLVEVIKNYPIPTDVRSVRGFLGLGGFYRRFIDNYAKIIKVLTALTCKDTPFLWTEKHTTAFNTIRNALCREPVLVYPDFTREFILTTDSSQYAAGAILSQKINGQDRVVGYASRQLNDAEIGLCTTERELVAVIFGVKFFNCYLFGRKFTIITDHRSLKYLMNLPKPSCKQNRWALTLAEYDFEIIHRPGTSISHADSLSRIRVNATSEITDFEPVWDRDYIKATQRQDTELKPIINKLLVDNSSEPKFALDEEGLKYRVRKSAYQEDRLVVPALMRNKVLRHYHDLPFSGHSGVLRTTQRITERIYWYGLHDDAKMYCNNCISCQKRKTPVSPHLAPLQRFQEVTKPWERVSLDIVGPLKASRRNNRYLLTFIDHFTKYSIILPMHNQTAQTVAKLFVNEVIAKHGTPLRLLTDRGTQFTSNMFREVCKLLQIRQIMTQSYNPKANGMAERPHRVINDILSHFVQEDKEWDEMIPLVSLAMNSAVSSTTGYSPYYLLYGRDIDLPFDDIIRPTRTNNDSEEAYVTDLHARLHEAFKITRRKIRESAERQEAYYDRKTKPVTLKVGDLVLLHTPVIKPHVSRKHNQLWDGPHRIIEQLGPVDFSIRQIYTRKIQNVNVNRLKLLKTLDKASFNNDLTPIGGADALSQEDVDRPTPSAQTLLDLQLPITQETYDPWDDYIFEDISEQIRPESAAETSAEVSETSKLSPISLVPQGSILKAPSIVDLRSPSPQAPIDLDLQAHEIPQSPPLDFTPIIRPAGQGRSIRTRYNLRDRIPMRVLAYQTMFILVMNLIVNESDYVK